MLIGSELDRRELDRGKSELRKMSRAKMKKDSQSVLRNLGQKEWAQESIRKYALLDHLPPRMHQKT
jgi:hypothetical protein